MKYEFNLNEKGYVDMDSLLDMIKKLPKVQQAIIHEEIQSQFEEFDPKSDAARRKANWMYS